MNKKLIKIISCLLAFTITFCVAGCGEREETVGRTVYNGTHDYTAPERNDDYIVKNGKTEYKLVVPSEQSKYIKMAKREFNYLFLQATGISLNTVTDDQATYDENAKYISLGKTSLLTAAGITVDKKTLGTEGHKIVTEGQSVFLVGGTDEGTLYAVYTFMEINFNYDCFYNDCISIDRNVTSVKLRDYKVTDIPDIPVRFQDGGSMLALDVTYDEYYPARMRELHPYWDKAHGSPEEFKMMTQYAAAKVIDAFIASPASENDPPETVVTISCEDNQNGCTCTECARYSNIYGTNSAAVIIFFNEVGRIVDEWTKGKPLSELFDGDGDISKMIREESGIDRVDDDRTPYVREDYHIIFFAYYMYTMAPCTYNDKGEATPVDDKVLMRDNIGVWLANIDADYTQSVYSETNKFAANNIRGWAALTDFVWNYSYWINFRTYNWFYDFFSYFNEDAYALMAANNTKTYYHQSSNTMSVTTNFRQLGSYLNSKLGWNSSLKASDLIDKYFKAMYKEAAPVMKRLFTEARAHYVNICYKYNLYGTYSCGNAKENKLYVPLNTMYSFLNRCDEALAAIEKYKDTDNETYTMIKNHIGMEMISPLYWILKFYADDISLSEKQRLLAICEDIDKTLDLSKNLEREGTSGSFRDFYKNV